MKLESLVTNYNSVNSAFRRTLVFRIGEEAGFFSEYNNMVLSIAWCLRNNIRFKLFSRNANFSYEKGWQDYFLPFCPEVNNEFHLRYNFRPLRQKKSYPEYEKILFTLGLRKTNFAYTPFFYRIIHKLGIAQLLTQDVFNKARSQNIHDEVEIKKLNFRGDFRSFTKLITDITWRFNIETQQEIDHLYQGLKLPENYLGLHIRGGDKFIEYNQLPVSAYIEKAESISEIRVAFVLTDSYKIITELNGSFSDWQFYTLCQPYENGYYHSEFQTLSHTQKKQQHIRLFASIKALENSTHFIGTFSSNPGMFLGMRMPPNRCYGLDFDHWRIW